MTYNADHQLVQQLDKTLPPPGEVAQKILAGFDRHYSLFRYVAQRAKSLFESHDWHGIQRVSKERIEYYDIRVRECTYQINKMLNKTQGMPQEKELIRNAIINPEEADFNQVVAGNIQQVIQVDSVACNFASYPYTAFTYARQRIIRSSNVTERSLVTRCNLINSVRSDNNPHGFTIEKFEILENKDIRVLDR